MRVGRIPYINCFPVYGGIDRGVIRLEGELVTGVPSQLNALMASGSLDVSVVSAVEYARDARRYLLLPDLAISCNGPVRSVLLFSRRPAEELTGRRVIVSRSSMTSALLTELLFDSVWGSQPVFVSGDAELADVAAFDHEPHDARLVIGDAALLLRSRALAGETPYPHVYDLGTVWRDWTGLPFVFAVWVAQRTTDVARALATHAALIASRDWGLRHLDELSVAASEQAGVSASMCREYFDGLDYGLGYEYLAGLAEFFRRLELHGRVPRAELEFIAG